MKTLFVIVGMQGSGKTTALEHVKNAKVLRPSTSRARRTNETTEYHFESSWDLSLLAWSIDRGPDKYGMRLSELKQPEHAAITVFDPSNISVLDRIKPTLGMEVITVGLDTIDSIQTQNQRVNQDPKRAIQNLSTFDAERAAVQDCDVVLSGDIVQVREGLDAVIRTVTGRGGLLEADSIAKLVKAGTLLKSANLKQVETASYDLTLADTYWCQGKYLDVKDTNGAVLIPPYSFVLVQATEEACLPRFVAGSFDLKVSMFLDGLILSNGPQIDPGYRGSLFCMLYNTSDITVPLRQGIQFATIQFNTTANVAGGYAGQYQNKRTFLDFVTAKTANSPGGKVLERINDLEARTKLAIQDIKTEVTNAGAIVQSGVRPDV